jgi:hypothetical protein
MQDESEHLDILFTEMSALECIHQGCTEGDERARYKTPPLEPQYALELLKLHREDAHGQQVVGAGGGANKVQLSKIPRPTVSGGCSQEESEKWNQYVCTVPMTP